MRRTPAIPTVLIWFAGASLGADLPDAPKPPAGFPNFKVQEIDSGLKIGYAVITADIDGDGKPDIVVADQHKIVWYQNPTWKKRVLLDGKTKPDNVCLAAIDIDGDKLPELVVGAGWKPFDTKNHGTLQWLKRGKTLDDEWTMHAIPCDEPMVHRVRLIDTDGDGKPEIVMAPLMGRDATKEKNWMDGRPVRILSYKVPAKDPEKPENWKPTVISEELHVVHNFCAFSEREGMPVLAASYEGVTLLYKRGDKWVGVRKGAGDQRNPTGSRGTSEVKMVSLGQALERDKLPFCFPTIEPWHGQQFVVYSMQVAGDKLWDRYVIDDRMRWGHALGHADFDGNGSEEIVVGVRDNPDPKLGDTFTEKRGVRIYRNTDGKGAKWERYILEDGGVAVEDRTVADLDGDGKPDIIAVGRATGNCRIYWNKGVAK